MRFCSFIYDHFSFNFALEWTQHCISGTDLESGSLIYCLNRNLGYLDSICFSPVECLCVAVLWHLSSFPLLAFLWVLSSSLRALPIIYDILLLVRSSRKNCSYGNCCFQTEWFQLQNNIIEYATAHRSFNGKSILMICTTKSENLNIKKKKGQNVWKAHLIEWEMKWFSAENFWESVWLDIFGKAWWEELGFEIMLSRDLWPSWSRFNRDRLNLDFDVSLFLNSTSLTLNPYWNLLIQSTVHWQHSTKHYIFFTEYLLSYYPAIVCFLCPTVHSFQFRRNEGRYYHWMILLTESFVNQVTKAKSFYVHSGLTYFLLFVDRQPFSFTAFKSKFC